MSGLRVVRAGDLTSQTSQTPGMTRYPGIAAGTVGSRNLWVGYVTMEPGARSGAHHHGDCESAIYIIRGRGRLVTDIGTAELEPGVAVFIPMGVHHATESDGPDPLELVSVFSPPVEPGSYEAGSRT